jgi:secreted trypsin-like serine protease
MKKSNFLLMSCFSILLLTSCGEVKKNQNFNNKINVEGGAVVGGKNTNSKNPLAKTIVAIVSKQENGEALCTGSIIDSHVILTAAHCVEHESREIKIIFGVDIHKTKEEFIRIADKIIIQPNWNQHLSSGEGDLALIHFKGDLPIGFSEVKLAEESLILKRGQKVIMAGFGVTEGEDQIGAGRLREMTTKILDRRSETEIITDGRKKSVCFGDSGGPAFIKIDNELLQWGVASSVANQACDETSLHTEIMKYRSWISSAVKKLQR